MFVRGATGINIARIHPDSGELFYSDKKKTSLVRDVFLNATLF